MIQRNRPPDITALSLLFLLGAILCAICVIGILLPVSESHPMFRTPALAIMGTEAVSWLVLVCLACVAAAFGVWRCSYWGFISATVLLVLFFAVHFLRALFTSQWWEILVILAIGALMMWYLRRRAHVFEHRSVGP